MKEGSLAVLGGHVVDPGSGVDAPADIFIVEGKVSRLVGCQSGSPSRGEQPLEQIINAEGYFVLPGLIDLHVHLRTPGQEHKEDLVSGGQAAARGGFTTVCCMPNTQPALDCPAVIEALLERSQRECAVRVIPFAAMTVGNQGQELTDFAALKRLGVAGISDDAFPLQESVLALEGFRKASEEGMLLALHSEDLSLASSALCSAYADLPEEVMLARNILFAAETGARLHLCHVSTARGVALLEWAKVQGVTVTAEACPHHLLLNEGAVERWGPVAKVKPPLRSEGDRTAVLSALRAGLLNVVATDHAPHAWEEKEEGFEKAPAGIVGLETALPLVHTYCGLPLTEVVRLMALAPARILGLGDRGHLGTGALGDLVILDAGKRSKIEGKDFLSKAKFTPFEGWEVRGEVLATVVGGEVAYQSPGLGNRLRREREAKKEAADIATRSLSRVVGKEEAR